MRTERRWAWVGGVWFALLVAACGPAGGGSSGAASGVSVPLPDGLPKAAVTLQNLSIQAVLTSGADVTRYPVKITSLANGVANGVIEGVPVGDYDLTLEYFLLDSEFGNGNVLVARSNTVAVTSVANEEFQVTDPIFIASEDMDDDGDGFTNLYEMGRHGNPKNAASAPDRPAAPTALTAADTFADGGGSIDLTWTPPDDADVTEQRIYRRTESGAYGPAPLATLAGDENDFTDTGLTDATTYFYVVRAFDQVQESANSVEAGAIPLNDAAPPDPDHFLTFPDTGLVENTATATAYYTAIDPGHTKATLTGWRQQNAFPVQPTASAIYWTPSMDRGRHARVQVNPDGTVLAEVQNYPTVEDAAAGTNLESTFAIEYGPGPGGAPAIPYERFYAFGADGNRLNAVNIDGRAARFIPGVCTVCHGGATRYDTLNNGTVIVFGNGGSQVNGLLLPWFVEGLAFPANGGLDRAGQESALKDMNRAIIENTNPTSFAKQIVQAAYGGEGYPNGEWNDDSVPEGWDTSANARNLYNGVVEPSCITCHVQQVDGSGLAYTNYNQFLDKAVRIERYVYDAGEMPDSLPMFTRFWQNRDPVWQPLVLATYLDLATGTFSHWTDAQKTDVVRPGVPTAVITGLTAQVVGADVVLDGTNSFYATNYTWALDARPGGSSASLSSTTSPTTTFTPDVVGDYEVSLTVRALIDGTPRSSVRVTQTVTVSAAGSAIGFDQIVPYIGTGSVCAGCHGTEFDSYAHVVTLVDVNDPAGSLLLTKPSQTRGTSHLGGTQLETSSVVYQTILNWIADGAPELSGGQIQPPVAIPDEFSMRVGAPFIDIDLLANDLPGTRGIRIASLDSTGTANGTITLQGGGVVRYEPPDPTFVGADTFSYVLDDGFDLTSEEGVVTVHAMPYLYNVTDDTDGGVAFAYVDLSSQVAALSPFDDDDAVQVNIGFDFAFMGAVYNQVWVSSNGHLSFGGASRAYNYAELGIPQPAGTPGWAMLPLVAPFFDDLYPPGAAAGEGVFVTTLGGAPSRFVVQWKVPHYRMFSNPFDLEVILEETTNRIYFQYQNTSVSNVAWDAGRSAAVGIQGDGANWASYNRPGDALVPNGRAILFDPVP